MNDGTVKVDGAFCCHCGEQAVTFKIESTGMMEDPYCPECIYDIVCFWCGKESVPVPDFAERSTCLSCGGGNILDWDEFGGDTLFPIVDREETPKKHSQP